MLAAFQTVVIEQGRDDVIPRPLQPTAHGVGPVLKGSSTSLLRLMIYTKALSKWNAPTEICRSPKSGCPIGYLALLDIYFFRSRCALLTQEYSLDMIAIEICQRQRRRLNGLQVSALR